ncbi:unnamed protein product [Meganyctiphanes norvegica]|uniref:long-chain-fatty-acid--CoA ligase n=1 Tax=Meganyctiphanes norvegica TaxID=48144 RepID=A0AAV2RPF8_MEGNR
MAGLSMMEYGPHGKKRKDGWWVCGSSKGQPEPLESWKTPDFLDTGILTLPEVFEFNSKMWPEENCMGTRELLSRKREEVDGRLIEKQELGKLCFRTYQQVQDAIVATGRGVRAMGIKPLDRVILFAETRAEWLIAAMGCIRQRIIVGTLYSTLDDDAVLHGITQTEASLIFTSFELLPRVLKILPKCKHIETIVIMEDQLDGVGIYDKITQGVCFLPFKKLLAEVAVEDSPPPMVDDIAFIMYTSGSTGMPKGVQLTHTNILVASINFAERTCIRKQDRFLAFLPLAHIMEIVSEIAFFFKGATVVYSSPHTLTSNSSKIMPGNDGDARVACPTRLNAVPLVLDRIIKGIERTVAKQGFITRFIFNYTLYFRGWIELMPLAGTFVNYFIFWKIQQELGGKLNCIVCGGAPLPEKTHYIIQSLFGCRLQAGYGLTETAGATTAMHPWDESYEETGHPLKGVMIRLEDWKEGGYTRKDKPFPRGEIIVGGMSVAKGYFRMPKETKEIFFEDEDIPCMFTGDIGEINDSGFLKIIDRKKDLVKLKHGEYISLGNIESKLKSCSVVENACAFVDSTQSHCVAVIVPTMISLTITAGKLGISNISNAQLCTDEQVMKSLYEDILLQTKECELSKFETPASIYLTLDVWSPDNGLLTAALKPKRLQLNKRYQRQVKDMYTKLNKRK